jgi:hypothetical protein
VPKAVTLQGLADVVPTLDNYWFVLIKTPELG